MNSNTIAFVTVATIIIVTTITLAQLKPAAGETRALPRGMSYPMAFLAPLALVCTAIAVGEHSIELGPAVTALVAPVLVHFAYRPGPATVTHPIVYFVVSFSIWAFTEWNMELRPYDSLGVLLHAFFGSIISLLFGLLGLIGAKRNHARSNNSQSEE